MVSGDVEFCSKKLRAVRIIVFRRLIVGIDEGEILQCDDFWSSKNVTLYTSKVPRVRSVDQIIR